MTVGCRNIARVPPLDALQVAVRREAEGTEADPFDEAMVAAVAGAAEALKAQADALVEIEAGQRRTARRK